MWFIIVVLKVQIDPIQSSRNPPVDDQCLYSQSIPTKWMNVGKISIF